MFLDKTVNCRVRGPFFENYGIGTFRASKAIFSASVSKNGAVYKSETSYVKGTSVHIKNT